MSDKPEALRLADALDTRVVPRWIHSTGQTPQQSGYAVDVQCAQAAAELRRLRAELQSVLDDWNALVKASGSPTNGGAIGHVKALRAECDALQADAERYRFVRDADRSDCITRELSLYAMESLDEYVDAAMEDAARAALKEAK